MYTNCSECGVMDHLIYDYVLDKYVCSMCTVDTKEYEEEEDGSI